MKDVLPVSSRTIDWKKSNESFDKAGFRFFFSPVLFVVRSKSFNEDESNKSFFPVFILQF